MPKSLTPVIGFLDEAGITPYASSITFLTSQGGRAVAQARTMATYELSDFIDEVYAGGSTAEAILAHAGNDKVNAGGGDDFIDGGTGNDQLYGGAGHDYILGGGGSDLIYGNDGDDVIDGGSGQDFVYGGAGNDVYRVMGTADVVTELAGEGTDTVLTNLATYTLGANLENLFAELGRSTTAVNYTGNALDNRIGGGLGNDTLAGGAGNDQLDGRGGLDTMAGGTGNDTYYVDNLGDRTVEVAGAGTDGVRTSLGQYTLQAHVENLDFVGTASPRGGSVGASSFHGIGNDGNNRMTGLNLADTLEGGAGNDTLDGQQGADMMIGGTGNDLYRMDHDGDQVVEQAGGGIDTVETTLESLQLGAHVENLWFKGSAHFFGQGNGEANVIGGGFGGDSLYGKEGNDVLYGFDENDHLDGGHGADTMLGGDGMDTYNVDDAGDVIIEYAGSDIDTVNSHLASYTLPAEVEELYFSGTADAVGQAGYGNALNNRLMGSGFNDSMYGAAGNDTLRAEGGDDVLSGGQGADDLTGYSGNDRFVFTTDDYGSMDRIRDFTSGQDKIDLSAFDGRPDIAFDQALWYRGTADFIGGGQGSVRCEVQGPGETRVYVDVNGDALSDLTIQLTGSSAPLPTVFDFVL